MPLGDLLYRGASSILRLVGNTTATKKFLRQTGDGVDSAAPAWDTIALDDLSDVAITTPGSGDALIYNGSAWVNDTAGTASALDDLTDVTISSPSADEVLTYNGSAWVNAAASGGGGAGTVTGKAANETVNNSDTFQDDDDFSFSVGANEAWLVELTLILQSASTASDYKFQWSVPVATTYYIAPHTLAGVGGVNQWNPVTTGTTPTALSTTLAAIGSAASGVTGVFIRSVILVGANAGTVTLQWAQNAATVADTTVLRGSAMVRYQVL